MHFIYNQTTNCTIAVVKAAIEPDAVIPSSEDALSIRLQWEAIMAGHELKAYPLSASAYGEALALFRNGEELLLHLDKFDARELDRARGRRERVRMEQERRRKRGVTAAMKVDVLARHGKGQKVAYIAKVLETSPRTVGRIIRATNDENATPEPV